MRYNKLLDFSTFVIGEGDLVLIHDTVGVDIRADFNLRNPSGCRRAPRQLKLPRQVFFFGHLQTPANTRSHIFVIFILNFSVQRAVLLELELALELRNEVVDPPAVKVLTSQMCVTCRGLDLEDAFDSQDGDIKRSPTQLKD